MAVRPIDGNALIEWFSPYLHTGEAIAPDVVIEDIRSMPTLTQPNEPLTLEQLREMDGEPVYMPDTNCWALVTQNAFCPILTFPDGEKCSVYDWYAQVGPVYRCPPEGESDETE